MAAGDDKVKLIVSYGGEIRRCPVSGTARYVGGENRLVKVGMSERLPDLRARLAALAGYGDVRIRYAIVEDGLDAPLHDVDSDGDLWRLVTILYFHRCRVRAFLFPVDESGSSSPAACLRQSASSPALASAAGRFRRPPANNNNNVAATSLLMRAQSAGPLHVAAGSSSVMKMTSGEEAREPLERADSGFEALAAIAEEQSRPPSSSANNLGRGVTLTSPSLLRAQSAGPPHVPGCSSSATSGQARTPLERTDSGFKALAAIAAEQRTSGGCAGEAGQVNSGLEAGAPAEQKRPPARPCPAPVVLVPVVAPVVAVFYPVIPVYQCVVHACVALHGRYEGFKEGLPVKM